MSRPRRATVLALALLLVAMSAAAGGYRRHRRITPVAALLDLEGAQASIGRPTMNGFVLGLQQASDDDPIAFSALIDTKSDPGLTRSSARAVASTVSLGAGFTDNDSVLIAGPFFERARVPFLSIGATDPALPVVVGRSIFLVPFGDNTQAAAGAEFGSQEFGSSVAILWDSTFQYSRTLPRYFRTRFEQLGAEVLLDEPYAGGCDIRALGAQVLALPSAPDFVYLAAVPDCVGELVASLRAAGVTQPILGGDGLDTPNLLTGSLGPTSDVWLTTHAWLSEDTGTPEARHFIAAYRAAYGAAPGDAFAALGYDAARLMLDALRRARGTRGIRRALEETNGFAGVTGTISYSADSHVPLKTVWVLEVQDGRRELARAFVPDSVPPPILDDH